MSYCLIYRQGERGTGLMYACIPPREATESYYYFQVFETIEEISKFIRSQYSTLHESDGTENLVLINSNFLPVKVFEIKRELKFEALKKETKEVTEKTVNKFLGWKIEKF